MANGPTSSSSNISPLIGTIDNITIFGTTFPLKPSISGYDARQLYVKSAVSTITGVPTLVVTIDENGPSSGFPTTTPTAALVSVSFKLGKATPVAVPSITLSGKQLELTASVTPSDTWPMWDQASFTLALVEGTGPTTGTPAGYVIVQTDDASPTYQLRWVQNPVRRGNTIPGHAEVIPPVPDVPGISGPFGLQTP